jgi:hypothetical protein
MGCPAFGGYPEGLQLCARTEACVTPGYVCDCGPGMCRLPILVCVPPGADGSDGTTEASVADGPAADVNNATDAAFSSDVTTDAPGD